MGQRCWNPPSKLGYGSDSDILFSPQSQLPKSCCLTFALEFQNNPLFDILYDAILVAIIFSNIDPEKTPPLTHQNKIHSTTMKLRKETFPKSTNKTHIKSPFLCICPVQISGFHAFPTFFLTFFPTATIHRRSQELKALLQRERHDHAVELGQLIERLRDQERRSAGAAGAGLPMLGAMGMGRLDCSTHLYSD